MQDRLLKKLHRHIRENNPDLLLSLQEEGKLSAYLKESVAGVADLLHNLLAENTPSYIAEERCMEELTKQLRPSKFFYLRQVIEEIFPEVFQQWLRAGILIAEISNLITFCDPVFEGLEFGEANGEDAYLRYAIIGSVDQYLQQELLQLK
jgi:hypothetical protein